MRVGVVSILHIVTLGIRNRHQAAAVGERLLPVAIRARSESARVGWRRDYDGSLDR